MYNTYNPYQYGMPNVPYRSQNIAQPYQQQNQILGEIVTDVESVKASRVDMGGAISYYPLADGNRIYSKQLMPDGTSKIIRYDKFIDDDTKTSEKLNLSQSDTYQKDVMLKIDGLEESINNLSKKIEGLNSLWGGTDD